MTECPTFVWAVVRRIERMTGATVDPLSLHEAWREIEALPTAALQPRMRVASLNGHHAQEEAQRESYRLEWRMLTHEAKERVAGKVPPHMTIAGKRAEHIKERCERIRQDIDMASWIERETQIQVSRQGRCPCPVHGGDGPSFSIRDGRGKCFACDWSGDLIDLAQHIWNVTPIQAIRRLDP